MSSIAPPEAMQDARLERIEAITARSDERLKAIQYGVGQTNTTLKSMDGTLGRMDGKLDRIVELLEALPDRLETALEALPDRIAAAIAKGGGS